MAEIQLRIVLNKGRHGILMHKLARIAEEVEKFLQFFSDDLNLDKNEWVADSFRNGSVSFTTNYLGSSDKSQIKRANKALAKVINPKVSAAELNGYLKPRTYAQFAKIASPIDADDVIGLGVPNEKGKTVIKSFTKERAHHIEREMNFTTQEFAGFQGEITALFKEGSFWLKDALSGNRIICKFNADQYKTIWQFLKERERFVDVEGWATIKNGDIEHLTIQHIAASAEYKEGDIDRFFGIAPDFTGDKSTLEYLSDLRSEDLPNG